MSQDLKLQRLLLELNKITGVEFTVKKEESDDKTIAQLQSVIKAYKEKYTCEFFLDRLLRREIDYFQLYEEAKRFHINRDDEFQLFYIKVCPEYNSDISIIFKNIFYSQKAVYLLPVDASHIVLILSENGNFDKEMVSEKAYMILDMMNTEAMLDVKVVYCSTQATLEQLPELYQEARKTMEIGQIFYSQSYVFSFDSLGIAKLIYELPAAACRNYVTETLKEEHLECFDRELMSTVNSFFENELNLTNTARDLYVHRNTLIYRLDKLQKRIGLDIRNFEDAVKFKVALMAMNYLQYLENNNQ